MSTISRLSAGLLCLAALSAVLASSTQAANAYADEMRFQLDKIAPTEEQTEPFRALLAEYFSGRNNALERVRKKTHMDYVPCEPKKKCDQILAKRISRELSSVADESVEAMSEVLMKDQLEHYEKFVEIANSQFMMRAGLK